LRAEKRPRDRAGGTPGAGKEDPNKLSTLDSLEASIIRASLPRLGSIIAARTASALAIRKLVRQFDAFEFAAPADAPYLKIPLRIRRDWQIEEVIHGLRSAGIEAERIYRPLHLYRQYESFAERDPVRSAESWERVFLIPNPAGNLRKAAARLCRAIEALYRENPQ